jgi:hypothetical protein
MSGPNLAREIANQHPAATVIASKFEEVIKEGESAIRSKRLQVYSNHDIYAVELAGVLKNSMALSSWCFGWLRLRTKRDGIFNYARHWVKLSDWLRNGCRPSSFFRFGWYWRFGGYLYFAIE